MFGFYSKEVQKLMFRVPALNFSSECFSSIYYIDSVNTTNYFFRHYNPYPGIIVIWQTLGSIKSDKEVDSF